MSPAIKFDQAIKEAGNERVILSPRAKHPYVCIYTPRRVNKSTIPEGWYAYEIRTDDDGKGEWVTIEESVLVNFDGTLLTKYPIKFGKGKDYYDLFNNKWGKYTWRQMSSGKKNKRLAAI